MLPAGKVPLAVARKAIRWIHGNLRYFDPFAQSPISEDVRHKAFAELALLCFLLRRHESLRSLPEMRDVLSFVADLNKNPFFETCLCRWNDALVPVLILTATLDAYELTREPGRRKMIQKIVQNSNVCAIERVPYRQLELRHILDAGGFAHSLPSYCDLWNRTLLAHRPNLMFLSDDDVYSITHVLFYLSDFSATKIDFLAEREIERIHETVVHLLGVYIRRKNWDLAAELLAAEKCLRRTSRHSAMGWRLLMQAQGTDGRMDGPYLGKLADHQRDADHLFDACYHTTLVTALAGAIWSGGAAIERAKAIPRKSLHTV